MAVEVRLRLRPAHNYHPCEDQQVPQYSQQVGAHQEQLRSEQPLCDPRGAAPTANS